MFSRHIAFLFLALILMALAACAAPAPPVDETPKAGVRDELVLATTTSTYDSGLLDYILPDFEQKTGVKVNVISVGTGQALALGRAGDADVLLVHARPLEDEFVAEGYAPARYDVMYNDFVIVGPETDPAGVRGMKTAADALKQIAESESTFVSRGDESGTHFKEKSLWEQAGVAPKGEWYVSAGQGMGAVLNMANEQQAYTLSDRSTFLAMKEKGLELAILVEGDEALFNPYGVLPVKPTKERNTNFGAANAFVNWITGEDAQKLIAEFGIEKYGQPLFFPNAK
ncbi:MAG: extracellular solute-binding protein [Chloroflexi bacterium]|nr:extracellular solute-binding protein [Chloroflexota bacterium]